MDAATVDIATLRNKPKSELTLPELKALESYDITHGPLNQLAQACKSRCLVLISCRNNRKLLARVKAFDRHCNMVLEEVREVWTEKPKKGRGQKRAKGGNRERHIGKMFLRGDSVILVVFTSNKTNSH